MPHAPLPSIGRVASRYALVQDVVHRDPLHTPRVGHELRSVLKRRLVASERVPQDPVPQVLPLHFHLDGDEDALADENFFPACLTGRGNKEIQARASDDTESVLHTPRPSIVQLDAVSPEKLPKIKSRDAEAKHHVGPHPPEGILVPLKHESLDATAKHHVGPHSPEEFFTAAYGHRGLWRRVFQGLRHAGRLPRRGR